MALRNQLTSEYEAKTFFRNERDEYQRKWLSCVDDVQDLKDAYEPASHNQKPMEKALPAVSSSKTVKFLLYKKRV